MKFYKYNNTTGIIVATGFSLPASVNPSDYDTQEARREAREVAKSDLLSRLSDSDTTAVFGTANPKTQKVDIATGNLVDYTPPVKVIDYAGANRSTRDDLLKETDWTQMPDSPLTADKKAEWATYRQGLRNLPEDVSTFTTEYLTEDDLPSKPS